MAIREVDEEYGLYEVIAFIMLISFVTVFLGYFLAFTTWMLLGVFGVEANFILLWFIYAILIVFWWAK